jgi:hypothetical protein
VKNDEMKRNNYIWRTKGEKAIEGMTQETTKNALKVKRNTYGNEDII